MVIYGAIYALASLSCTIGPFLAITAVAMDRSVTSGLATYVSYALGMGVVILVIAAASALTRPRPIAQLRRLSRYAGLLGGILMILSGAYAMWYGRWELAVYNGDLDDDRIVNAGENLRIDVVRFIEQAGALRLTTTVLAVVTAAIVVLRIRRHGDDGNNLDDDNGTGDLADGMTNVGSAPRSSTDQTQGSRSCRRRTPSPMPYERAHVTHHHHRHLATAEVAAAIMPLVRPLLTRLRFATERWADETAACEIGDRRLVARAIARAALASRPADVMDRFDARPGALRHGRPRRFREPHRPHDNRVRP
ncbi:hypothetical protein BH20ACT4_BH20ACT4_06730 [soil metagenome]|jgi:hypothetical protein